MKNRICSFLICIAAVLLLTGCTAHTLDSFYAPPKRSQEHQELQTAIDLAMQGMEYSAPRYGENQQTVQKADLDGDGQPEYLLFSKSTGEKPLHILVFRQQDDHYLLMETIDSSGTNFDRIEYVSIDDKPGSEIVVGMQLNDQVLRSVSVYTFSSGQSELLMSGNYSQFITSDLDCDENSELMILRPGETAEQNGIAEYYSYGNGIMERSTEAPMSRPVEFLKRIMVSKLENQAPAIYAASMVDENSLVTDVFSVVNDTFTNISLSDQPENSVQTLRNYYVYADDIDDDGIIELPELITMKGYSEYLKSPELQHLIRWYSLMPDGTKVDKKYTYHNFDGGWYLELAGETAERIWVAQNDGSYIFYLWDNAFNSPKKIITIYAFTGQDREEKAVSDSRFLLYRTDTVIYACQINIPTADYDSERENIINSFHLIRQDWKTGET